MLFYPVHTDQLKEWLTAELGPICDADPEVLSDYVLALLKHESSQAELQKLLKEQLEDFLAAETDNFVAKTFSALMSKSYLPSVSSSAAQPSTSDAPSSRKRRADDQPDRSSPPRQTRRLDETSPSARNGSNENRPAIYDEPLDVRPRERDSKERNGGAGDAPTGPRSKQGGHKQMCRDYHNMGYCPRGSACKFEHSNDTLPGMPGGQMPMGQFGTMGPMMGGGPMGQMTPGQGPLMLFPGGPGFGLPPQGWAPSHGMNTGGAPASPHGTNGVGGSPGPVGGEGNLAGRLGGQAPTGPEGVVGEGSGFNPEAQAFVPGGMGGGRGGFGMRCGRGRGGHGHFQSNRRSNTTLVIENVPAEHLDLIKVNEYFKKFGTITNISIDVPGSKALVSYSQPHEAKSAHESPDVIFGNRFVKVYFQRLDEPQGGAPVPPQSAYQPPPKSNFVPGQNVYHAKPSVVSTSARPASEERKKLFQDQKAKQAALDAQLAEQKTLLAKLSDKSVSAEERKGAMTSLKKLGEDIKASTEAVKAAVATLSAAPAATAKEPVDSSAWKQEREKREKEQLDRELELHSKGSSAGSTTEGLKKKLESLKAEAASLGIDAGAGGFAARGRGRGAYVPRGARGGFRGRGAPMVNRSMRLDNRTTRLKISELPEGADKEKVQEHLKKFGQVESFADAEGDSLMVVYKARASGEQALRGGLEIPDVGTIKMTWVQPLSTPITAAAASIEDDEAATNGGDDEYEDTDRDSSWKR